MNIWRAMRVTAGLALGAGTTWAGGVETNAAQTGRAAPAGGMTAPAGGMTALAAGRVACVPAWQPTFSGAAALDGPVHALLVFDDGSGPALYAGGSFVTAGGVIANGVARWDGETWSALGDGTDGTVFGLAVYDDGSGPALYAAGDFTAAGGVAAARIARWDGAAWSPLGAGLDDWVRTLAVYDDGAGPALYAGGAFTSAGGAAAVGVARWDGAGWSDLAGGVNGGVLALTVFDDGLGPAPALYVGGWFTQAGGVSMERLARWDGAGWSFLGHVAGTVRALAVHDDGGGPALFAAGQIGSADGVSIDGVARWAGDWSALGAGLDGHLFSQVGALAVFDGGAGAGPQLYAGGSFDVGGGAAANRIARWDGAQWRPLGAGIGGADWQIGVDALAVFDAGDGPALYVAGNFTDTPAGDAFLARWGCVPVEAPDAADEDVSGGAGPVSDPVADGGVVQLPQP